MEDPPIPLALQSYQSKVEDKLDSMIPPKGVDPESSLSNSNYLEAVDLSMECKKLETSENSRVKPQNSNTVINE